MLRKILAVTALGLPLLVCAEPAEFTVATNGALNIEQMRQQLQAEASSNIAEMKPIREQMRMETLQKTKAKTAEVTVDEVGDVDSFGRAKIYLGVEQTDFITLQADCSGADPDAGPCVETNPAPASTLVDIADVGSIQLPGKATNSLLCFSVTDFKTWSWFNSTAAPTTAEMSLRVTIQIENDALLGLVDANGNPFNGVLNEFPFSIIVTTHQETMQPGAFEVQRERITRNCTGGLVNTRTLAARGLTDAQIKDFFKTPMTIRFGTQGRVSLVDFGLYSAGIRLYGD